CLGPRSDGRFGATTTFGLSTSEDGERYSLSGTRVYSRQHGFGESEGSLLCPAAAGTANTSRDSFSGSDTARPEAPHLKGQEGRLPRWWNVWRTGSTSPLPSTGREDLSTSPRTER